MEITYSISLWNFSHYTAVPSLERALLITRQLGFGIELWGDWREEKDLFDTVGCRRLKPLVQEMNVSLHSAKAHTFTGHQKQIEAAACLGAKIIVLHPSDLMPVGRSEMDVCMAREIVAYAAEKKVKLVLENGELPFLEQALAQVEGLGVCLDVGHVYLTSDPMKKFLDALKSRIVHLHIQDVPSEAEKALPLTAGDHYIPGTGGIVAEDWNLLVRTLREIDFHGAAVFEIRPRTPFQTAYLGKKFIQTLM